MTHFEIFQNLERSKKLAKIVAHLMADGCVTNRYLRYCNKNKTLLQNFKRNFESLFQNTHFIEGTTNSKTNFVQVQNKEIISFLREILSDFRSSNLQFPKFIDNLLLKKEFLIAFYDDEGCVSLRIFKKTKEIKRNLTLSSNSEILIRKIKEILEKDFLIKSNKLYKYVKKRGGKTFTNYVLSITGKENFEKFREKIGFSHPEKIIRLNEMINSYIRK